jgi:hypothetical protein
MAWASQQPTWAIGFQDEVWWSRFALPRMHAWQDPEHPVRLVEPSWKKGDPDPKALACYGVLWQEGTPEKPKREQMWLRFVSGRPVSAITTQFLDWCSQGLFKQGKTHWLLSLRQCFLAQEPSRSHLDSPTQPAGQADGHRCAYPALSVADTKPLAQPD